MHVCLQQLLDEVRSHENVERAAEKIGLVLESSMQKAWDQQSISFLPHAGLYDRIYGSEDITQLLAGVEKLLNDPRFALKKKALLIQALGKLRAQETFDILVSLFRMQASGADLLEQTPLIHTLSGFAFLRPELLTRTNQYREFQEHANAITSENPELEMIRLDLCSLLESGKGSGLW